MLSDYNNIITPNLNNYNFLNYNKVPRYLKNKTSNNNFDFKYDKGSILVPNIVERLDLFLELNNLTQDKQFVLKKLRKLINEVTSDERKKKKIKSIKNARNKQCNKYNNNVYDKHNNFDVNDNYQLTNDTQLPKFNYNITQRKSGRIKKKATKYNPYTGQAQIVGTGRKLIYLRK